MELVSLVSILGRRTENGSPSLSAEANQVTGYRVPTGFSHFFLMFLESSLLCKKMICPLKRVADFCVPHALVITCRLGLGSSGCFNQAVKEETCDPRVQPPKTCPRRQGMLPAQHVSSMATSLILRLPALHLQLSVILSSASSHLSNQFQVRRNVFCDS